MPPFSAASISTSSAPSPRHDETQQFLADTDPNKRTKLIDQLLADPRFSTQQANVWDLVLFGRHPPQFRTRRGERDSFKKWLAGKFAPNEPYDRWVRDLLLAEQQGTELFYVQYRNQPEDATVAVSRIFLGTQLQCARCHDHPFESWTQRDFYGMAGFFVRLVVLDKPRSRDSATSPSARKAPAKSCSPARSRTRSPARRASRSRPRSSAVPTLKEPPLPKGFKEPALEAGQDAAEAAVFAQGETGRLGDGRGQSLFCPRRRQPRLGAVPGPGLGASGRRSQRQEHAQPSRPVQGHDGRSSSRIKFDLKWLIRELVNSETYQLAADGASRRMPCRRGSSVPAFGRCRRRNCWPPSAPRRARTPPVRRWPNDATVYFLRYFGATDQRTRRLPGQPGGAPVPQQQQPASRG